MTATSDTKSPDDIQSRADGDTAPAWSDDKLADPHAAPDKAARVRAMFAAIAPSYDLNNRVHSLWRDQAWRRAAVRAAHLREGDLVLDAACGTGDLTLAFARALARRSFSTPRPAQVLGVDFTHAMLPIARGKARRRPPGGKRTPARTTPDRMVAWLTGDAMALPVPDRSVDVTSIAFGIRNVADPRRAIAEFHRALRPGGRAVILEFSLPTNRVARAMYNFYFNRVMPRTASLIARDRSGAYRYLPRSVNTFIDRDAMVSMMTEAGFKDVTVKPLTMGIAVVYRGVKRNG